MWPEVYRSALLEKSNIAKSSLLDDNVSDNVLKKCFIALFNQYVQTDRLTIYSLINTNDAFLFIGYKRQNVYQLLNYKHDTRYYIVAYNADDTNIHFMLIESIRVYFKETNDIDNLAYTRNQIPQQISRQNNIVLPVHIPDFMIAIFDTNIKRIRKLEAGNYDFIKFDKLESHNKLVKILYSFIINPKSKYSYPVRIFVCTWGDENTQVLLIESMQLSLDKLFDK
tara:strand:- start:332 stop:1006 length:675 start_codon:yes stop_codon:yes gene_type:complete